jgi:N-acetyl sugar amidotransferase
MKYCKRCLMPDTKPDLWFDDRGVCSACINYENRPSVDYAARKQELVSILERYRSPDGSNYDCIVPVSGGKDSTYQVIRIKELGFNPLAVTSTTCHLSDIGRRNIENLKNIGVDYIEFTINPNVRRKLNRIGLLQVGDISWPEHVSIFTIPFRAAVQYKVPLIVWGENPQHEYGGPAGASDSQILDRAWMEEFGGLIGLRVSDLIGQEGLEKRDLVALQYPEDADLKSVGVTGLYLGYYIPWDGLTNYFIAQAHGFESYPHTTEVGQLAYENLDNYQTGIHDYFKYLKFGFGRATDHVCMQIRRGRLTRTDGLRMVQRLDGKFPWTYLGKPIQEILAPLDIELEEFIAICDRFTNKRIFETNSQGQLVKDRHGNLTKKVQPEVYDVEY